MQLDLESSGDHAWSTAGAGKPAGEEDDFCFVTGEGEAAAVEAAVLHV